MWHHAELGLKLMLFAIIFHDALHLHANTLTSQFNAVVGIQVETAEHKTRSQLGFIHLSLCRQRLKMRKKRSMSIAPQSCRCGVKRLEQVWIDGTPGQNAIIQFGDFDHTDITKHDGSANRMEVGFAHRQGLAGDGSSLDSAGQSQQPGAGASYHIASHGGMVVPCAERARRKRIVPTDAEGFQLRAESRIFAAQCPIFQAPLALHVAIERALQLAMRRLNADCLHDDTTHSGSRGCAFRGCGRA